MANTLFLRLSSPLQSWGEDSQWSERRTAPEPTKSGIVGLLACALGWSDDARVSALARSVHVGVRCDAPGTLAPLVDYHTVGGGYKEPQLLDGRGKPKYVANAKTPHTEPTWRYYLCDASFLVALRSDPDTIGELAQAVQFPVWQLYLGRKSCVPTVPPFEGIGDYASLEDALERFPARCVDQDQARGLVKRPRVVIECDPLEPGSVRRRDQTGSRKLRVFGPRYSYEYRAPGEIQIEFREKGD